MSKYLKSSVRDETLVVCLLMLVIALQAFPTFSPRMPLVGVEGVKVVVEVLRCVKYFISYGYIVHFQLL